MKLDELDPGNVVVRTKYSTINYKDALSHNARPDHAQVPDRGRHRHVGHRRDVVGSARKKGDKVIVHAYDMGVAHDGGYAEYVRVPGDWIVRRPRA